ncbi:MAG: NADH-quinone oxidoreductase subunit NuoB [Lachnospiraceae bacterium]|nr:NADH-quinone oxidoreductase subunit NuoB [Lachnospiraceae bacterium]
MFENLIKKSAMKSPWLFHINAGSCNGCDIEIVAVTTTLYDAERFGFKLVGSPRHADIVVVSGPVTMQSKERLIRTLAQVPEPKCVVSIGSCPQSGNVFKGSYAIDGPLEKYVHVDVAVAGCAPKPQAIMEGLYEAAQILEEKREMIRKAKKGVKGSGVIEVPAAAGTAQVSAAAAPASTAAPESTEAAPEAFAAAEPAAAAAVESTEKEVASK